MSLIICSFNATYPSNPILHVHSWLNSLIGSNSTLRFWRKPGWLGWQLLVQQFTRSCWTSLKLQLCLWKKLLKYWSQTCWPHSPHMWSTWSSSVTTINSNLRYRCYNLASSVCTTWFAVVGITGCHAWYNSDSYLLMLILWHKYQVRFLQGAKNYSNSRTKRYPVIYLFFFLLHWRFSVFHFSSTCSTKAFSQNIGKVLWSQSWYQQTLFSRMVTDRQTDRQTHTMITRTLPPHGHF